MKKVAFRIVEIVSEFVARPVIIILLAVSLLISFIGWTFSGFDSHYYEVAHLVIAIITLIVALIIEGSEKSDTRALHIKLDEIIKALPKADNKQMAIEKKLKRGKVL